MLAARNSKCNWQSAPTTTLVFGTNIHPELAKLQCEQGALHSYREAEANLKKLNVHRRQVNNHNQVKQMTNQVGSVLAKENRKPPARGKCPVPARKLIVQVDGGHIPIPCQERVRGDV